MAKRDAADYITKDGKGSMSAPPERVSRPATAAQMAQRKLKAPRGRLHSGVSSFSSPSFTSTPSPFGQAVGATNQSLTSFGNNTATGTPQFGNSASFPPTQPSSNNFTPTPPSGSFTFGASTTSNPFSNFGGNTGNNNGNTTPFGGFGAQTNGSTNSQPDGDTMMESPQKKPPTFGSAFGTGSTFQPSAASGTFGLSSQKVPPSGFGTQPVAQPFDPQFQFGRKPDVEPGNVAGFGAQRPEEPKPKVSFFGQSLNASQSATNPFGQSTSAINPPSSPFGQPPAASHAPGNVFGSSVPPTQPAHGGPFGTSFGQAPAPPKSADVQMSLEVPKPAFGFAPSTSQPLFASPAATTFTSGPASSNTNPQTEELTPISSAPDSVGPIFSGRSDSSSLGDIFKPNGNARLATPNIGAIISDPFTFKPTAGSGQLGFPSNAGLFGAKPSVNNTSGSLFGQVTRTEEPPVTAAASGSSPNPVRSEQQPSTTSDDSVTTANLIEKAAEAEAVSRHESKAAKPREQANQLFTGFQPQASTQHPATSPATNFGYQFAAASNDSSSATQPAQQPSTDISKGSVFTNTSPPVSHYPSSEADSQANQPSWHASKANSSPAKPSLSSTVTPSTPSKASAATQSMPSKSEAPASPSSASQVRLRSHGSSAIPGYLDSNESVEHDSLSRLRNLNFSFQKKIAKLDPAADDFEEIVRHYIAQRANIGHALNLMERRKAGRKRKMDSTEADEETLNGSKKARTEAFSSEPVNVGMPQNATINSSTSSSIQPPKAVSTQPTFQKTGAGSNFGSSSSTSGTFQTMSSPAPASSAFPSIPAAPKAAINSFAGLESSAPSSSSQHPSAEPTAPAPSLAPSLARDAAQYTNPFASLGANSSKPPGSSHDSSSTSLFKPQLPSTTPTKSPPKKPAFEIPKFGAASGTSFMDAFAKKSAKSTADLEEEAKRKRKAEDFDSDEDDEAEWERKYEEEQRAKRNKLESLSKSGFKPLFGDKESSATAQKFLNIANDKASNISSAPEKSTPSVESAGFHSAGAAPKAAEEAVSGTDEGSNLSHNSEELEESGSEEEDLDQGSEEDASEGDQDEQENYDEGEEQPSDEESEDEDIQAAMARSRSKRSLFDRIEPNPNLKPKDAFSDGAPNEQKKPNGTYSTSLLQAKATPDSPDVSQAAVNNSFRSSGANGVLNSGASKHTPDAPAMSPFTPINGSGSSSKDLFAPAGSVFAGFKKSATEGAFSLNKMNGDIFTFGSNTSEAAPTPTRSVLFGGNKPLGSGAIPGEGLFGSRPSTPSNDEPSRGSVFGNLGSGPNFSTFKGDNTYKPGTPIKFGTPDKDGPTVNITAATPPAKDDSSASSKTFPSLFGPKPSKPGADAFPNVGFNFGGPTHLTASPLLGASALSSAVSSRATSPGATDTESVNTDNPEDHTDEPQTSLMSSRPGEENEEVLFEGRSKALKLVTEKVANEKKLEPGYHTQGVGQLRVLKHKTTGKTRLLLRAEPASNIVINTSLLPSIKYKAEPTKGSGAVKFVIPTATGLEQWVAKVKTPAMADELASILEANKGETV